MLLFIGNSHSPYGSHILFKYISCYCLSPAAHPVLHFRDSFKYISCYCLSLHLLQIPDNIKDSNTSHVIVYQAQIKRVGVFHRFKYISCYCLSHSSRPILCIRHQFKYISCYCLSGSFTYNRLFCTNSNTSHVIVYHILFISPCQGLIFKYISCYCLSLISSVVPKKKFYSNTSHVIVYPVRPLFCPRDPDIQIHLMLLFI